MPMMAWTRIFVGGAGIAADGFRGLEADETDADGGAKAAEAALDASCDFSDVLMSL